MTRDPQIHEDTGATIRLENVSRWYGEILGVNKVNVSIAPGITGLMGPNGSGKSTMMNMISGLIRPGQGEIIVLGEPVWNNRALKRRIGLCAQVDHFYENFSGLEFVRSMLALHGHGRGWADRAAREMLEGVGMTDAMHRRLRAYSKGMRQRIKIALALAHKPEVLILDEPFNGLDPVGRHEMMRLFIDYAAHGHTLLISSHILHEIEQMTDRILMISNGYVVAEGQLGQVRDLLRRHPFRIYLRCAEPRRLAALMLAEKEILSVEIEDERAMTLRTRDTDRFYTLLNNMVLDQGVDVDLVTVADENMQSVYQYLSGREHH